MDNKIARNTVSSGITWRVHYFSIWSHARSSRATARIVRRASGRRIYWHCLLSGFGRHDSRLYCGHRFYIVLHAPDTHSPPTCRCQSYHHDSCSFRVAGTMGICFSRDWLSFPGGHRMEPPVPRISSLSSFIHGTITSRSQLGWVAKRLEWNCGI